MPVSLSYLLNPSSATISTLEGVGALPLHIHSNTDLCSLSLTELSSYPDYADNQMLAGAVSFDFVGIITLLPQGINLIALTHHRLTSNSTIITAARSLMFQALPRSTTLTSTHGTTGQRP